VQCFDDVCDMLMQDPLGRADLNSISESDMQNAFDKYLLNFKTIAIERYEALCKETVSALSLSVGGVADEEDEVFAFEVARDVMKEDARFDRCPSKNRKEMFLKAVDEFRNERIRNSV
jgi:hypothetical protein